ARIWYSRIFACLLSVLIRINSFRLLCVCSCLNSKHRFSRFFANGIPTPGDRNCRLPGVGSLWAALQARRNQRRSTSEEIFDGTAIDGGKEGIQEAIEQVNLLGFSTSEWGGFDYREATGKATLKKDSPARAANL